jgi:small subunit ribosomal protein S18
MARNNNRNPTARRGAPKDTGRRIRKKPCAMCRDRVEWVDYKDVQVLKKYLSDRGKIRSRRVTGNCAQHQRAIAMAIKTARELVLLPYTQRTVTERPGGRAERDDLDGGEYLGRETPDDGYDVAQRYVDIDVDLASEAIVADDEVETDLIVEEGA